MPRAKQSKLTIPKSRRHIKQKNAKSVQDESTIQIGGGTKQGSKKKIIFALKFLSYMQIFLC